MPFLDRMTGEVTPLRLQALCRLVDYFQQEKTPVTQEQLFNFLQPEGNKNQVQQVFSIAKEGNLIATDPNGHVSLQMDKDEIKTMHTFRRAIAKRVFNHSSLIFCRFTAWYIGQGQRVYSSKPIDLAVDFNSELNQSVQANQFNDTNVRAWRPWVTFLGLGYSQRFRVDKSTFTIVIPNAMVRLQDVLLENKTLERERPLPFSEFMQWLQTVCPDLDGGELFTRNQGKNSLPANHLSLAVSAGLRALHDLGEIKLRYVKDARDTWYLAKAESHEIPYQISEIVVGGK